MASEAITRQRDDMTFGLNNFIAQETSPSRYNSTYKSPKTPSLEHARSQASLRPAFQSPNYQKSPRGVRERESASQLSPLSVIGAVREVAHKASRSSPRLETVLPRRRKESVTDLAMDLMTTVHECAMDSPTIPGRPAVQGIRKAPKTPKTTQTKMIYEESTPRPSTAMERTRSPQSRSPMASTDCIYELPGHDVPGHTSGNESDASDRRRSSVLLPKSLAPLVIPTSDSYILPAQAYKPVTPAPKQSTREDTPPKVPPKSPKTLTKAFPKPKAPSPGSSATSPQHTASNSVHSLHTPESASSSTKPWTTPIRGLSPNDQRSTNATTPSNSPPRSIREPEFSPKHKFQSESVDERPTPKRYEMLRAMTSPPGHSRGASESSVINRGRPMKRGDGTIKRVPSRPLMIPESPALADVSTDMPRGVRASRAASSMTYEEIRKLKKQAEVHARNFEILYDSDFSDLTRELALLNERCKWLIDTHSSLHKGRRDLHNKMISILNSPKTAQFSRDKIVQQEQTLADLDSQINEWYDKLQQAEDRRQRIRQKLMEHTAAVLLANTPATPLGQRHGVREHTPPRSPDRDITSPSDRSFSTERRDVESIRVYADSGVASLLASIEMEISNFGDLATNAADYE